jgi:hypothetical protein
MNNPTFTFTAVPVEKKVVSKPPVSHPSLDTWLTDAYEQPNKKLKK